MVTVLIFKGVPYIHHWVTQYVHAHHPIMMETHFLLQRDKLLQNGILKPNSSVPNPSLLTHVIVLLLCYCD